MGATATVRKSDFIDAMEENQKDVRKMVMDRTVNPVHSHCATGFIFQI